MRFTLLGAVDAEDDAGVSLPIGGGKMTCLLAFLLVEANHFVATHHITEELWHESEPPKTATTAVQVYVSRLRKALQEPTSSRGSCIITRENGYQLSLVGHEHDVADFRRLTAAARKAEEENDLQSASELLHEALRLWRGEPLGNVTCGPRLVRSAHRLKEARMATLEHRIDVDLRLGQDSQIIGELHALIGEFPMWEKIYGYLMIALYRSGRTAEALAVYQRLRERLVTELGLEPSVEVSKLQEWVLTRDPRLEGRRGLGWASREATPSLWHQPAE